MMDSYSNFGLRLPSSKTDFERTTEAEDGKKSLIFSETMPTSFTGADFRFRFIARTSLHQNDEDSVFVTLWTEVISNPKCAMRDFLLNDFSQMFERRDRGFCSGIREVDNFSSHRVDELSTTTIGSGERSFVAALVIRAFDEVLGVGERQSTAFR